MVNTVQRIMFVIVRKKTVPSLTTFGLRPRLPGVLATLRFSGFAVNSCSYAIAAWLSLSNVAFHPSYIAGNTRQLGAFPWWWFGHVAED
jgi:hypothetical protein